MILQVLKDTHPKLRKVAGPANPDLAHHRTLGRRLFETMMSHKAYGIAANQVNPGELVRVIALNVPGIRGVLFNPVIVERSEETATAKEGCLSAKDQVNVTRAVKVIVEYQNGAGEHLKLSLEGLSAAAVQHEIDHLDGKIIADYL